MPELPEVETIRRGLEAYVVGYCIEDVAVKLSRIVRGDITAVIGGMVHGVRRYGKGLVIDLDNGYSLAVHVKMTGKLVFRRTSDKTDYPDKWTHVIFKLHKKFDRQERAYLYYSDVRQFGWIHVVLTADLKSLSFFKTIGPEPLRDLDLNSFRQILRTRNTFVKVLLMDQQKIAGVGNIYANDALYLAHIHPLRSASSLSDFEMEKLFLSLEEVLRKSIALGGTSASNYVNVLGERGGYQKHFLVYQKEGDPCENCGRRIERLVVGGRSTFFCVNCQK